MQIQEFKIQMLQGFPLEMFLLILPMVWLGAETPKSTHGRWKKTPWWNRLRGGLHNFLSYTICVEMILQLDYIMYVTVWIYSLYIHILRRNYAYGLKILHYTYIMRFGNFHTMTQRYKIYIFVVDPKIEIHIVLRQRQLPAFFHCPQAEVTPWSHICSAPGRMCDCVIPCWWRNKWSPQMEVIRCQAFQRIMFVFFSFSSGICVFFFRFFFP